VKFRSRTVATIAAIALLQLLAICVRAQTWRVPVYGSNAMAPEITVVGAIGEKWRAMGAGTSALKQPVANEQPTFDNVGRSQQFQGGIISWHPSTGAHVVWGLIGKLWLQLGREQFGYPITDELPTGNRRGLYNHFRAMQLPNRPESSIFWSKTTGAHVVYGAIRDRWARLGWERSKLGFPIADEFGVQIEGVKYRRSNFQYGYILWSQKTGAREKITIFDEGPELIPVDN
jgi:uncharacterized protein with LGFP repeats